LRTLGAGVLLLQLGLTLATALWTLRDFPNSADEYAYVLSAELFAEGRLAAPSPAPRDAFAFTHVLNDGKYYGKYPPGWPALLAAGVKAGVPWLVNPLLGLLGVALTAALAREVFSEREAKIVLLLALGNPFLVFNAASYFSHPACLAGVGLSLLGLVRTLPAPRAAAPWLVAGGGAAVAFLARPYTAVACLLPAGAAVAVDLWRRGERPALARGVALGAAPLAVGIGLWLLYNGLQTGHALRQPFTLYDAEDRPRLASSLVGWVDRLRRIVVPTAVDFNVWIPLAGFGLILGVPAGLPRRSTGACALYLSVVGLFVAYAFYPTLGGNRYGPRYVFEAAVAAMPILAAVLRAQEGVGRLALAAAVLLNVAGFVHATRVHARQVRARMTVYDLAERAGLRNAVVFLSTGSGSMPPGDLTRNGTRFDGPVLYVHDLGPRNAEVLRACPGRAAYVFAYDTRTGRGELLPYRNPERAP
jgi:hypothetical protein